MKVIILLFLSIAAVSSDDECDTGEECEGDDMCCIIKGIFDTETVCKLLNQEGEGCNSNYTEDFKDYLSGIAYCPCDQGLVCRDNPNRGGPFRTCQEP